MESRSTKEGAKELVRWGQKPRDPVGSGEGSWEDRELELGFQRERLHPSVAVARGSQGMDTPAMGGKRAGLDIDIPGNDGRVRVEGKSAMKSESP